MIRSRGEEAVRERNVMDEISDDPCSDVDH